jgi:hypothetical protein
MTLDTKALTVRRNDMQLRWVAAGTGLVTFSSMAITTLYLPMPVMMIAGAAITGRWPRLGRLLMWISALALSGCVLPVYLVFLYELLREKNFALLYPPDSTGMLISLGWLGTLILLPLCDVLLVLNLPKAKVFKIAENRKDSRSC